MHFCAKFLLGYKVSRQSTPLKSATEINIGLLVFIYSNLEVVPSLQKCLASKADVHVEVMIVLLGCVCLTDWAAVAEHTLSSDSSTLRVYTSSVTPASALHVSSLISKILSIDQFSFLANCTVYSRAMPQGCVFLLSVCRPTAAKRYLLEVGDGTVE